VRLEVMQGHRNVQLHVSMYCPEICQLAMAVLQSGKSGA
jgi:hypothetical protein